MTDEFTASCSKYYRLTQLLYKQDNHFKNLLDNAPPYTGQMNTNEMGAIISCARKIQNAKAKVDETFKKRAETGGIIMEIMEYFGIPRSRVLTGQVPGEMEFELCVTPKNEVLIIKTCDLENEPDGPNMITIKCVTGKESAGDDLVSN